ncbi:uncharacterized protein B0T15DRAFT_506866 [Chaetomium strumarium]|uniref:Uncharacterized protein n=1 Tax=Chaetomium strumarium TaxID=1170767 RepID=A0AAJ0H1M1_9PEZI|nr:hypothetical protein B0T15DRAFT_506866 [Chaetomium strumarium]
MGFDCGFDIYPRLDPAKETDKRAYREFLDEVINTYKDANDKEGGREDGKVLQLPEDPGGRLSSKLYITFMVGEWPRMPASPERCNYFLRFSSKVSGRLTQCAEPYIRGVHRIARRHFGSEDPTKRSGYYNWSEVYEADEKLKALASGQEQVGQSANGGEGQL